MVSSPPAPLRPPLPPQLQGRIASCSPPPPALSVGDGRSLSSSGIPMEGKDSERKGKRSDEEKGRWGAALDEHPLTDLVVTRHRLTDVVLIALLDASSRRGPSKTSEFL